VLAANDNAQAAAASLSTGSTSTSAAPVLSVQPVVNTLLDTNRKLDSMIVLLGQQRVVTVSAPAPASSTPAAAGFRARALRNA
jgi:hypothetical protein